MAKRLNYTIGVNADTSKFQTQIKAAFESLSDISQTISLEPRIQEASAAALELGKILQAAMNPTTGKLDLTRFNSELTKSGKDLAYYQQTLSKLKHSGQEAFMNVAQAITSAEMPLKRTSKLMNELWITMKNTMRWQLTSSVLNSFTGALQTAYGYSKSLDASLNNIRIVSNKSADDMKEFAEYANKAAKALSATTTDYTDASLIYYQQGLSDEEVLERTDTTIKMANVAGQTAQVVSDQMTAVWNNFYDGSKSIEYYADVMVKLGAATASSTDEIAQGLEKFAAVGNTVGLSYEYATSVLATITSNTRQSADVVGTALKTIFARIQDLELGETLDDGTTLGTYSKALEAVGINVLDANGQLVKMDIILDELGEKWDNLSNAQQVALAQAIAGVRQYNQIVSLMDNWDSGDADSMQANLGYVQGAEGELDKQATIYAESWEAARDRVTAAAEDIYDSLINPDFYIGADNVITPLLSFTADLIDGMGGLNGVLSITALLMNKVYSDKIAQTMRDMAANIGILKDSDQQRAIALKEQAVEQAKISLLTRVSSQKDVSETQQLEYKKLEAQKQIVELELEAVKYAENLNDRQTELLGGQIQEIKNREEILDLAVKTHKEASENADKAESDLTRRVKKNETWRDNFKGQQPRDSKGHYIKGDKVLSPDYQAASKEINEIVSDKSVKTSQDALKRLVSALKPVTREYAKLQAVSNEYESNNKQVTNSVIKLVKELGILGNTLDGLDDETQEQLIREFIIDELDVQLKGADDKFTALKAAMLSLTDGTIPADNAVQALGEAFINMSGAAEISRQGAARVEEGVDRVRQSMSDGSLETLDWADTIVSVGSYLSTVTMGVNALSSGIEALTDSDLTPLEKFNRLLSAAPMLITSVVMALKILKDLQAASATTAGADAVATTASGAAKGFLGKMAASAAPKVAAFGTAVQAALGPIMLIVGIAAAVVAAISAIANAAAKAREERIENAKEAYQDTKEEIESNNELIDSYEQVLATYQETGEGKVELSQAALEVADALGIEGAAVANLTGDYEALTEAIKVAKTEQTQRTLTNAESAKFAYGDVFVDAMRKGKGHNTLGGGYTIDLGGYQKATDAQSKALANSAFAREFMDENGQTFNGEFQFSAESNPESLAKMYEAAQQAAEDMRKAQRESGEEASDTYNELIAWLAKSQTAYEEYKAVVDEATQASFDLAVDAAGSTENIDSYSDYLAYYQQLNEEIENRVKNGEIEESKAESLRDAYLAGADGIKKYVLQQELLNQLTERFGQDFADNKVILDSLGNLDEKSLAIAVSLVGDAGSIEEFTNLLEQRVTDSLTEAAITSFQTMGPLVQELNKNNEISEDNYKTLKSDDTFMAQMEEDFGSFENFQKQAQRVQIEYVRDYYTAISQFAVENLAKQEEQANQEYAITLFKYNALQDLEQNHSDLFNQMADLRADYASAKSDEEREALEADWKELQEELSNAAGFEVVFDIGDSDETLDTLDNKLKDIQDEIDAINDKRIEIAMDWDDFDDIKGQMDSLGDFATTMQKDAQKVGNSYQYPIDAVRDWMEIYPDLFQEATVTNDGLIALDQDKVDGYITGKQDEVKANAQAKIDQWELEKADLEATREKLQAEVTAYQTAEQGKIDISVLSNQQIADLAQQLTQYQIDCGVDEATAHANTLNAMGLNEEQYSEIVADVSQKNAENTTNSANEGAKNSISAFQKMSAAVKNIAHNVLELGKSIASLGSDDPYTPQWSNINDYLGSTSTFTGVTSDKEFTAIEAEEVDPIEAFKAKQLEQLELDLSAIDEAIATLDSKILAAKAFQEVDNAWEGSSGPDKTSGSDSKAAQEKFDEALERYHEITREIEYQQKVLDKLDKQIDRTYGLKRLELYQKKIEELNKLADLQSQKATAALAFVASDAQEIGMLGLTPNIDQETLEIVNYTELLKQTQDEYKAFLEKYNSMTKAEQEEAEEEKEAAKTLYDKRIEALEAYEESVDTYREEFENMEDTLREIEDAKLSVITIKLEVAIDVRDMQKAVNDLSKTIAESFGDAITHGLETAKIDYDSALLDKNMLATYQEQWAELQQRMSEATEYTDTQAIKDAMQDLQNEVIGSAEALVEWANSIEDIVPDAVDAAAERFAAFTDQLDHNTSVLDTIKELYALQGVTYKTMDGFNRLQKVSQEKLEAQVASAVLQKSWYEEAEARLAEAQAKLDSLNDDETDIRYDAYKKARDAYLEEFNEAQEAYLSSAKEAMETAQEMYTQQIEKAVYEFGQAISNGVGLDLLQEQYDHYIEESERYLDTVNEAYQVASWYNKLQKDIDESTNSVQAQRLKDLQKEIDARRENNTLSEYDLEILEAKYNVLQAQMALEDAQNAKNNLQLVRDSQGNWNYQYTADQDKIADAEQGLLDAQNDWYNIAKQQVTDITGEIVTMWKECQDKVKEIYTDDNLTYEEKLAAAEEVQKYYSEKAKYLEEEKNIAIRDMNEAGSEALIGIAQTTGEETADLIGEFTNTYADKLGEMTQTNENFEKRLNELLDLANQDFLNYQDTVDSVAEETGTTLDDLAKETDKVSDATDILRERGEEAANNLWDQIDAAQNASDEYLDLADSIWKAVDAMQALARQQANYAMSQSGVSSNVTGAFDADTDYSALMSSYLANGADTSDEAYLELLAQRDAKIAWLQSQGYTENYWKTSGSGTTSMFNELLSGKGDQGWYKAAQEVYGDNWQEKLKELGISGFATGGYTGTFDDARLAFLHEKELVLNQEDTANILAAVHAVRDFGPNLLESIEKALDNNTIAAMALMGAKLTTSMVTPQSDVLEQTVHIDKVEFPNVTSRTEIEEAFISLTNDAAQWARRRI